MDIDLGREPLPVAESRRDLAGVAALEAIWSEGDFGLEVCLVSAPAELRPPAMRRAWEARRGSRAIPLVLIWPKGDGMMRICGPSGPPPSVRDLATPTTEKILRRALMLGGDVVVEALRADLARGSGSGNVPGVWNNGLVSTHFLLDKLPKDLAHWGTMMRAGTPALGREGSDIFGSLGYEVTVSGDAEFLLRFAGAPVALAHIYRGAHLFDRFIEDVGAPASAYALARARHHGAGYGLLVSGPVARLLSREPSSELGESAALAAFLDIATDILPPERAGVIGACYAPDALRDGGHFAWVRQASERYAVGLRDRFRDRVYREVVPALVRGIAHAASTQKVKADPKLLYRATMLGLFRTLFVLYAEDRDLLPVANPQYRPHSLTERIDGLRRTVEGRGFDPRATDLWDDVKRIFTAIAEGHQEWGVPPYDGGLFVDDRDTHPEGAFLARLMLPNSEFGPALYGLAIDRDDDGAIGKVDFGDLGVRHIGNLYEGLLSYEVALADEDLAVDEDDPAQPFVPAGRGMQVVVRSGEPYMRSPKGGRKASGSYYTPAFVVDRLISQSVVPALERHLASLPSDPAAAAARIWDFKVCDPAMGSGHFLVSVVDAISDGVANYLYEHPLADVAAELQRARIAVQKTSESIGASEVADVKDVDVLRRLVLKRCVYGVDLNPMAVELARLSLWLHAFVPGLPLFYLGHTLRNGNSLVGTIGQELAGIREVRQTSKSGHSVAEQQAMFGRTFFDKVEALLEPVRDIASSPDLELHEVQRSAARQADLDRAASEVRPYLDAFTADPLDTGTVRERILHSEIDVDAAPSRETAALLKRAATICNDLTAFHWVLGFPEVFLQERPGFDAVVANPPWDVVKTDDLRFYGGYIPGLVGEKSAQRQRELIARYETRHPEVRREYEAEVGRTDKLRLYLQETYLLLGRGTPDLFKAFSERFFSLCREGGNLGVVLPRSAFAGEGSELLREHLFTNATALSIDFLINRGGWVFEDAEHRMTLALVSGDKRTDCDAKASVSGPADRMSAFSQLDTNRLVWTPEELRSADLYVPLTSTPEAGGLFHHCYAVAPRFDADQGDWLAIPWREFDATNDMKRKGGVLGDDRSGWPVYSSGSFDLWNPDLAPAPYRLPQRTGLRVLSEKMRRSSTFRRLMSLDSQPDDEWLPQRKARIAFRKVTRATDSRTVRVALLPPCSFIVDAGNPLIFVRGDERAQAYVLGVLSSLVFDWLARRRVEANLNFFILNALPVPRPASTDPTRRRIASLATRLACVDERFAEFASANGVKYGPVAEREGDDHIAEIDALVALLYQLTAEQLEIVFSDFPDTDAGASAERRAAVRKHFARLTR